MRSALSVLSSEAKMGKRYATTLASGLCANPGSLLMVVFHINKRLFWLWARFFGKSMGVCRAMQFGVVQEAIGSPELLAAWLHTSPTTAALGGFHTL
jgi:hypothetical protein